MDPKNPRWATSEERIARSSLVWKLIASAAAAAALTGAIVVSCLGRDGVGRSTTTYVEPPYVETVAGAPAAADMPVVTPAPTPVAGPASTSTADSTGGAAEPPQRQTAEPTSTTRVTSTTIVVQPQPAVGGYSPKPSSFETADPQDKAPSNGATAAQPQGSNPDSPRLPAGAGPFITEAPYWSSSAWGSSPDAGAGRFETERNTPAR